jgi:hypothetical protein
MERVSALLRDYRVARPRLLTEHFSEYGVQQGGDGAGTVIVYRLRVGRHQGRHVVASWNRCRVACCASAPASRRW